MNAVPDNAEPTGITEELRVKVQARCKNPLPEKWDYEKLKEFEALLDKKDARKKQFPEITTIENDLLDQAKKIIDEWPRR